MSTTYIDLPSTKFPDLKDSFPHLQDADQSVITQISAYQQAIASGDDATAQQLINDTTLNLTNYLFTAEKYNTLADAVLALERYFVNKFEAVVESLRNKIGLRPEKGTTEENNNSAYTITASERLFEKKSIYSTIKILKDNWVLQSGTVSPMWIYDFENPNNTASYNTSNGDPQTGIAYLPTEYDLEIVPSNWNDLTRTKIWGKHMFLSYVANNWIGTRVGIPSSDLWALVKITRK